ncbi:MAG: helix-turn-helix domain-containing protein [Capsulimonadaceae bacterium]|nr:helix-turn-helix domain-containing protein [Capsulimonadaceae bacterium]
MDYTNIMQLQSQGAGETAIDRQWLIDQRRWSESAYPNRSTVASPTYARRYCGPRIGTALGWHREWEMTYVFAGRGKNIDAQQTIQMRPGLAILIPPMLAHRENSDTSNLDTLWLGLTGDLFDCLPRTCASVVRCLEVAPDIEALWLRTRLPYWSATGLEIDGATQAIAGKLVQMVAGERDSAASEAERLSRIIAHIHARFADEITAASLAALCDISEGHLYRWFRQATGYRPMEYVTKVRIENAQEFLAQTGLTVAAIAGRCGFADPLYFSRVFHHATGVSPREWRQRNAADEP